jgi:uncharacterized protein (DUF1697 family)
MADLRAVVAAMGFADVRSILQSGNLVFQGPARSPGRLERTLEVEARKRLALRTDFFLRTAKEWSVLVSRNPFPKEAERDPARLVVMFLKDAPGVQAVRALQTAILGREIVRARSREAYIVYPDGMGRSRLTAAVIDRALKTSGTARNWNTVRKLAALVER